MEFQAKIHLIYELHEDEGVEDNGATECGLVCRNAKHLRHVEYQGPHDTQLEDTLSHYGLEHLQDIMLFS